MSDGVYYYLNTFFKSVVIVIFMMMGSALYVFVWEMVDSKEKKWKIN